MILVRVYGNSNPLTKRLVCYAFLASTFLTSSGKYLLVVILKFYFLFNSRVSYMLVFVSALVLGPHEQERFLAILVDPVPYGKQTTILRYSSEFYFTFSL